MEQFHGKKIVYVDMDLTLCDYATAYRQSRVIHREIDYPQSVPGFFASLAPLPDAVETYHWLHAQSALEVFILTAPSVMNPHCYTEKRNWVERHLGFEIVNRLIISPNKGLLKGHYLIDDDREGRGQEFFEGELITFGSLDYPNWAAVKKKFQAILNLPH